MEELQKTLAAEVRRLQKDGERLDWLSCNELYRGQMFFHQQSRLVGVPDKSWTEWQIALPHLKAEDKEVTLRQAIDAAITTSTSEGNKV